MAIQRDVLADFSGGLRDALAAQDFDEGQWAVLFGVVLESDRTLSAQWAGHTVAEGDVTSFGVFDGVMVYREETSEGPVWFGGGLPLDESADPELDAVAFTEVSLILDGTERGKLDSGYVLSVGASQMGD